jgi:hypothetical protein
MSRQKRSKTVRIKDIKFTTSKKANTKLPSRKEIEEKAKAARKTFCHEAFA